MSAKKIVVIGAGAIGLCSALHLVTLGHDVTLIEGDSGDWEHFGAAASLAAAGMLAPLAEAAIAPPEAHPKALELMMASLEVWRGAQSPHVRFGGGLILGSELAARARAIAEANGLQSQFLSQEEISKRFGLEAEGGVYIADEEATVAPLAQLSAWLSEFRARGGKAHFDIEADTIEKKPWGRAVRCLGGEMFSADHIVLTPGIWARDSLIEAAPALAHLRPAKGHLCDVKLQRDLSVNIHAPGFYLAARGGADAVLGSTMEFDRDDRRIEAEKVQNLRETARAFLPGALVEGEGRAWAGVRPMSPDWAPMIGRSGAQDVIVACGHSRNGWLLAPITARIVAAYVDGKDIDPLGRAFAPDRF